jgi:outer membrane lipoprotein-sorting protein
MYHAKPWFLIFALGAAVTSFAQSAGSRDSGRQQEFDGRRVEESSARLRAQAASSQVRARELLLRSMERQRFIPSTSIVLQHGGPMADCLMQVRIDQSREGRLKMTVLSPLSMQGVASIDNGKEWITYLPDEKRLMVMPSPRLAAGDPRFRVNLADKNYVLRTEPGVEIAGRKTIAIVAQPKSVMMPVRRFYLDEENNYLLRLETQLRNERKVLMDTKAISYPNDLPDALFELRSLDRTKKVAYTAPIKIATQNRTVRNHLTFRPVLPQNLPFGFAIQEPQMGGEVGGRFVAVRITDGLASATVYQWDGRNEPWPFEPGRGDKDAKGIRMRIIGEMPDNALRRILDVFVGEAFRRISTQVETDRRDHVFKDRQELSRNGADCNLPPPRVEPVVLPAIKIDPPF